MYEKYLHHGKEVMVRSDLKGRHREHCLCFDCSVWSDCKIREDTFNNCVTHNIASPVWECPNFVQK